MLLTASFLIALFAARPGVSKLTPPTVDLGYARYQGIVNPNTQNTEFLGIRFAAPPTGQFRWSKPRNPRHENGLQIAHAHPAMCHQFISFSENISEDCLFLNVYTPGITTPQERRPVVVWIHGGAYALGSASDTGTQNLGFNGIYDGNDLILQSGGKVVVVKEKGALNAGLLDQQFALKWVQRHINKFGGDPKKVTIWGQSAGAGSVLQHLVANGGNTQPQLFRSGILSSSYLPSQYPYNHFISEFYFNRTVELTGCSSTPTLDCLRAANITLLQSINTQLVNEASFGSLPFAPVVDGSFIKESPTRALQGGRVNTNHILAVRNTREAIFVDPSVSSLQEHIHQIFPTLSSRDVTTAVSLYNQSGTVYDQASAAQSDATFICPTYLTSNSLNGCVYQAQFAVPPSIHTDDIRYYFPSAVPGVPPFPNPLFVNTFAQVFMDFVLSQDPNKKHDNTSILPTWPRWSRSSPVEMIFNRTGDAPVIATATSSAIMRRRCEFWAGVAPSTFQ